MFKLIKKLFYNFLLYIQFLFFNVKCLCIDIFTMPHGKC